MSEPIKLVVGNREYYVGHFTQACKNKFTAYLKGEALQAVVSQKQMLGAEYTAALDSYVFDCAHGKFDFYGEKWWKYVQEPGPFQELLWLCMSQQAIVPKRVVQDLIAEHRDEVLAIWKQLLEEDCPKKE